MGRAGIRTATKAAIVSGGAFGAGKVRIGKLDALAASEMPCAVVWTGAEKIEPITIIGPRRFEHVLNVHVDIYARAVAGATTSAEEAMDSLVDAVEAAIHNDVTLAASATDCFLVACDYEMEGDAGNQYAVARMTFNAYFTTIDT